MVLQRRPRWNYRCARPCRHAHRDFDDFGFTKQLINPISIAETSQCSVSLSAYLRSTKDLSVLEAVKLS
jgi:hypothetical protein